MPTNQYPAIVMTDTAATIANGQTASAEIDLAGTTLCGLFLPSNFSGTSLTLQASSASGGTYVSVFSGGSAFTLSGSASSYVPIESMPVLAGVRFIKLVAGTTQTANVIITLSVRPV